MSATGVQWIFDLKDRMSAPVKNIVASVNSVTQEVKRSNQAVIEASRKAEFASKKRKDLLRQEKQDLAELKIRRKSAFSVSEIDAFNRRIEETTRRINTLNSASGRSSKIMGVFKSQLFGMAAGAFGLYQGFRFLKGSVEKQDQQLQAEASVKASLQSTGGISGKTFGEISNQASSLQKKTLFGDEEILQAQSVLLTFTNIRKEIFDKTTPAILDLATKMKMDLQSATVQVGKAMNDPIHGITALQRAGIQFTAQQKENIKQLVESGRIQEAQLIILNELQRQFGGSAEEAAKTGLGPWKQLSNIWGDARETLGGLLMSVLNKLLPVFKAIVSGLQNMFSWMKRNSEILSTLAKIVGIAAAAWLTYKLILWGIPAIQTLWVASTAAMSAVSGIATGKIIGLTGAMKALALATRLNPVGLVITAVAAATAGIYLLTRRTNQLTAGQKAVIEVQRNAQRTYLEERFKVEQLARVVNDANAPYEARKKNLEKLKELSNEHFGALKLEKEGVEGLDKALKSYLDTRQKEIFQAATKEKQEEFIKKQFDLQAGLLEDQFNPSFWQKSWAYIKNAMSPTGIVDTQVDMYRAYSKNRKKFIDEEHQAYSHFMKSVNAMGKKFGFNLFGFSDTDDTTSPDFNFNKNEVKGGEGIKNINITIGKLVETISVRADNMEQSAEDFADKVVEVFLQAVNDANFAQI